MNTTTHKPTPAPAKVQRGRTTYDTHTHGFVAIEDEIFPIVMHLGNRVWIKATLAEREYLVRWMPVSDGLGGSWDGDYECVLSVPVASVTRYLEPTEAVAEEAAKEPRSARVNDRRV